MSRNTEWLQLLIIAEMFYFNRIIIKLWTKNNLTLKNKKKVRI